LVDPRQPERPQAPEEAPPDGDSADRSEQLVIGVVLAALGLLMALHLVISRWRGDALRLERLPQHELDYRVDINAAGPIELMHLPGVGPALAERIIQDRTERGPFRSPEDLQRVRGIGPKIAEQIAPFVRWTPQPQDSSNTAEASNGS
jgi:competence protein ComEA